VPRCSSPLRAHLKKKEGKDRGKRAKLQEPGRNIRAGTAKKAKQEGKMGGTCKKRGGARKTHNDKTVLTGKNSKQGWKG